MYRLLIVVVVCQILVFSACKAGNSEAKQLEDIYFLERTAKNTDTLIQVYTNYIKNHPNLDTNENMYIKLATIYFERQNNISVINTLNDCIKNAKTPEIREHAMRMYALVNDQEKKYDVAKKAYNDYLNEFPGHENAAVMKQALDVCGLTAEEIMKTWSDSAKINQ